MRSPLKQNPEYESAQRFKRRIGVFYLAITIATCALLAEALIRDRNAALDHARMKLRICPQAFENKSGERSTASKAQWSF